MTVLRLENVGGLLVLLGPWKRCFLCETEGTAEVKAFGVTHQEMKKWEILLTT